MPLLKGGQKTLWIYTGVFLFMCVLTVMAPIDAMPLVMCMPALYAVHAARYEKQVYALGIAMTPALLVFLPGHLQGAVLYLGLIACGVALSWFMSKGRIGLAVFVPACLVFAVAVADVVLLAQSQGVTVQTLIAQWLRQSMNQVLSMSSQTTSAEFLAEMRKSSAVLEGRFVRLFWGITASSILTMSWLNLLIAKAANRDLKLRAWRSPDWMVGFFVLAGVLILMNHQLAHLVGLNLMIVIGQMYFFQGLAIVSTAMIEYNWNKVIRGVIYVLILMQIYIMIIVAALGLFDTWFNFRKMIRNPEGDKK